MSMPNNMYFVKLILMLSGFLFLIDNHLAENLQNNRNYNLEYSGKNLDAIAYPIGGIGAGMICIEGTGAISHVSVRNKPDLKNEPFMYAALTVIGKEKNTARILEGQVPDWKYFLGKPAGGRGLFLTSYGLPRFKSNTFSANFPFAEIKLEDKNIPLDVTINAWSPFIPGDADNSSLPAGAIEYTFVNSSNETKESVFSFNSENFMSLGEDLASIKEFPNGFLLWQNGTNKNPENEGGFVFFIDDEDVKVNHCWFRGVQDDERTMTWADVKKGNLVEPPPKEGNAPGASMYVPFSLEPGKSKTIRLKFCWYVPNTNLRRGVGLNDGSNLENSPQFYKPWYTTKFKDIYTLAVYWRLHYKDFKEKTKRFTNAFYSSTLPNEVLEAIGANLTILKSPTLLRQTDGRLWGWEGCDINNGLGDGSCTHVWNYAQAIPHLFPELERTLRKTEFNENQTEAGAQRFRALLPIREIEPGSRRTAADGQLGGIMKVHREWRICADKNWLKEIWPKVKKSMEYCINQWDPKHKGIIEEPHHNTYDIEFWGPDAMGTNFYLGALTAMIKMGNELNEDVSLYSSLLENGKEYLESELFNGEYFIQQVQWKNMEAGTPQELAKGTWTVDYDYPESIELLEKEGPKYQYGNGCMSDGVLGLWIAKVCGIDDQIVDSKKVKSHLKSIYKYNLRENLIEHENPQRPGYALGDEGGLLLCTWPNGGKPTLPFIYSDEVWTGIEYQVASHLISEGMVDEGLEIVRICRDRYDGKVRNPFNEYEYGSWYARAMASYGLLQALTGIRYDAVDETLYIDSQIGDDFKSFISTEKGFGLAGLKSGKPFIDTRMGEINIKKCYVSGKKMNINIIK